MLRCSSRLQQGVGVLPVALILLAGAALMLLFAQRNLLVDLRITQNGTDIVWPMQPLSQVWLLR